MSDAIDKTRLLRLFSSQNIHISEAQAEQFENYAGLLVEWNQKINLTAITEPQEIEEKHFLDSCLPFADIDIPEFASVVDVGTGARCRKVECFVRILPSVCQSRGSVCSFEGQRLRRGNPSCLHGNKDYGRGDIENSRVQSAFGRRQNGSHHKKGKAHAACVSENQGENGEKTALVFARFRPYTL